jgi:hypothetical protein
MKRKFSLIILISIIVYSFNSCTQNEKIVPLPENLDIAVEEVFAADLMEDVFMEIFDIVFDLSEYGIFKSEDENDWPDCRVKTVERPEGTQWPKVVTLDFGEGCEDKKENVRKGKIIITIKGKFKEEGSTRSVTFKDYYVNDNRIEGTKLITNTGRIDGFLEFSVVLNKAKIITEDGVTITRDAWKTRVWIEGEETPTKWDNVFLIYGTVEKTNKDGIKIFKNIIDLVRAKNCRWPVSGIVEITTDHLPLAVLDYGDGECDKLATVTIGEGDAAETWIVDLKKRGKKWKKQDDDDGVEKEGDADNSKDDD